MCAGDKNIALRRYFFEGTAHVVGRLTRSFQAIYEFAAGNSIVTTKCFLPEKQQYQRVLKRVGVRRERYNASLHFYDFVQCWRTIGNWPDGEGLGLFCWLFSRLMLGLGLRVGQKFLESRKLRLDDLWRTLGLEFVVTNLYSKFVLFHKVQIQEPL